MDSLTQTTLTPSRMTSTELLVIASVIVGQLSGEYPELSVTADHNTIDGAPNVHLWLHSGKTHVRERRQLLIDVSRAFGTPVNGWETSTGSVYADDWNGTGVRVSCLSRIDNDTEEAEVAQ